jgi:hypothetical protein
MSNSIMLEMTIAINGPVHFDDFVFEINSELDNAVTNFDMNSYNAIVAEMAEFNLKPGIILDAPIEIELPNRANDVDDSEFDNSDMEIVDEEIAGDPIDAIMNGINAKFPDNNENSEMSESDKDSALLDF